MNKTGVPFEDGYSWTSPHDFRGRPTNHMIDSRSIWQVILTWARFFLEGVYFYSFHAHWSLEWTAIQRHTERPQPRIWPRPSCCEATAPLFHPDRILNHIKWQTWALFFFLIWVTTTLKCYIFTIVLQCYITASNQMIWSRGRRTKVGKNLKLKYNRQQCTAGMVLVF